MEEIELNILEEENDSKNFMLDKYLSRMEQ